MINFFKQFADTVDCYFLTKSDDINVPTPRVRLHQVHGSRVIVAREPSETTEQADGVITNVAGLNLMARAADCQNFAVYSPEKNVGGVMHVGWRGVLAGTISEFFRVLKKEFAIDAADTVVVAGPSMCLECAEYKDPEFELRQKIDAKFVHSDNVDLIKAANEQLLDAGVPAEHFERHPDCTSCNSELYWAYRGGDREAVERGNSNVMVLRLIE